MEDNLNSPSPTIFIQIDSLEYSLTPGSTTNITFQLDHQGENSDYFEIGVRGIPASWTSLSAQVVSLAPHEQREISLTIQPPPPPQSEAGIYPIRLIVTSQSDLKNTAQVELNLHLAKWILSLQLGFEVLLQLKP